MEKMHFQDGITLITENLLALILFVVAIAPLMGEVHCRNRELPFVRCPRRCFGCRGDVLFPDMGRVA